jgi:hypothetical protein
MGCLPLGSHQSPAFAQMTSDILLGDADGSLVYVMGQSFYRLMFCAFKSFRNLLKINCNVFQFFSYHFIFLLLSARKWLEKTGVYVTNGFKCS